MESTPQFQDISEDSGCFTGSSITTPFSINNGSSSTSYYNETPMFTSTVSRKRKLSNGINKLSHRDLLESLHSESSFDNDVAGTSSKLLSSTLNESLSKSLEKCNLGSSNCTLNFYRECSPDDEQSKRYKLDDSPNFQPKTRSAPSTPTKHLEVEELCNIKEKSKSEHLNRFNFTPVRNTLHTIRSRLGSPERIELLYPNIKLTPSPLKLRTPEKLREFLKKINSPAKKRLFENSRHEERRVSKKVDQDPISVFVVKNDFRHVVSKIFGYLSDGDLCTVSKVSKTWKRCLLLDCKAFARYYSYSQEFNSNKENIAQNNSFCKEHQSPPASPARDSFHRCTRIASQLLPNQSLQKCIRCMEPAVIQGNISQCQNTNCEYIYCTICLSFSTSGPEHFVDRCQTSKLLIDKQKANGNRFGLCDLSNGAGNNVPSFLLSDSPNSTPPMQTKYDSSGYLSGNETSPVIKQNSNIRAGVVKNILVSRNINRVDRSLVRHKNRRPSLASVVSASSTPKIVETIEPPSPPRKEYAACSKQSKKNLKRLHF